MSPFARADNGLSGMKFKIVSGADWAAVTFAADAMLAIFNPTPGFMAIPIAKAIITASAVVNRYIPIVIPPIFPIFRISDMDATPTTIEKNTRGTTSIFISLMNTLPPR